MYCYARNRRTSRTLRSTAVRGKTEFMKHVYSADHITKQICTAASGTTFRSVALSLRPRATCENLGVTDLSISFHSSPRLYRKCYIADCMVCHDLHVHSIVCA